MAKYSYEFKVYKRNSRESVMITYNKLRKFNSKR